MSPKDSSKLNRCYLFRPALMRTYSVILLNSTVNDMLCCASAFLMLSRYRESAVNRTSSTEAEKKVFEEEN